VFGNSDKRISRCTALAIQHRFHDRATRKVKKRLKQVGSLHPNS